MKVHYDLYRVNFINDQAGFDSMFPGASALVCGGQSTAIARGCGRILLGKLDHCRKGKQWNFKEV
jgi:hypothetical protein